MSKLLIVDDSKDLLEMMKYIVECKGYTVKTLINTDNIYKEIDEFKPDLLILDIFLNGADGRDICKTLRNTRENKDLGILVFSVSPKALEDYRNYFADDSLEKPFDIQTLMSKIKSMLEWIPIRKKAFSCNTPIISRTPKNNQVGIGNDFNDIIY